MAYRYIDLAAILSRPQLQRRHLARRLAMAATAAIVAGLVIGGAARVARADTSAEACPKGTYADFWSDDVQALTRSNTVLSADQAKQFIIRLNASKAMDGNALPIDGTTIHLLVHKDSGRRFGLAINKDDCVIAYGFVDDDFLAYLLGKGPIPARYELPGDQI
jgi:hypothetical protein